MAIKMKFSEITNGQLMQILHKIGSAPIDPNKTFQIRKISKMLKQVIKHSTEISTKFRNDILPLYAVKREDGTFIDRDAQQGKPFEIIKEKEAEYKVALDKFNDQEVTIEDGLDKLNWKDISHANIKPMEVLHLDGLFNEESLDEMLDATEEKGPGVPSNVSHIHS